MRARTADSVGRNLVLAEVVIADLSWEWNLQWNELMVSVPDLVGKFKTTTKKLGCVIQYFLSGSHTEQKPSMESDSTLALPYEPKSPNCRRQERWAGTLLGELETLRAWKGLVLPFYPLGKRAAPGKNSEVENKPLPLWDSVNPKTVQNDSDINIIISELAGSFIQV